MRTLDLKELFPLPVGAALGLIPAEELPLTAGEEAAVSRAVPKRRQEFAAGRDCARRALCALGIDVIELLRLDDGQPAWPEGVVGAISHSRGWCGAVVARAGEALGLGLDIEATDRMSERAARYALSSAEMAACRSGELEAQTAWTLRFSAKESVYKCLYPLLRRYIGFGEAEIELGPASTFTPHLVAALSGALPEGSRLQGRYRVTPTHLVTALTLLRR